MDEKSLQKEISSSPPAPQEQLQPQLASPHASTDSISSEATQVIDAATTERNEGGRPEELSQDVEALGRVTTGEAYTIFSQRQKHFIVFIASFAGFFSPLAGNIYFPALNDVASDLKVSSELINLTLTSYLIFQGIAPTVMGDLADMAGRRPVYILCFVIFIAADIGLALQKNYTALFVLRCLQSSGSSGTIALSYGSVADVSVTAERGTYMGYASSGFMLGPSIGPVVGGILAQYLGWPAIFWFLAIFAGALLVAIVVIFPETARNVAGNGSVPPQTWNMSLLTYIQRRRHHASTDGLSRTQTSESGRQARAALARSRKVHVPNPLKAIKVILEKDCALLLFYNSFIYTAFYCVTASLPLLLEENYNYDTLHIGLVFIPYGVGCASASIINGRLLDYNYSRIAKKLGLTIDRKRGDDLRHYPIEKARLQIGLPLVYIGCVVITLYGWMQDIKAHVAAPIVLIFFLGIFVNGSFNVSNTLLVDLYPSKPSTATSANNLVRCLMGAAGSAVITPMIRAMGKGWCFTFIALFLVVSSPMQWALLRWGPMWREERRVRLEEQEREKAAKVEQDDRQATAHGSNEDEKTV
ncbi:MAG: hypothetical protein MMC23_008768 [Stictis urceolatum]|nr:hypothetical protein [Stictis urceolata]